MNTDRTPGQYWIPLRLVAGFCALICTILYLFLVPAWIRNNFVLEKGFDLASVSDLFGGPCGMALLTAGLIGWWMAFRGSRAESRRSIGYSLWGGVILGSIGFVAGFFFIPPIFMPSNNLGPLLGILCTGPLGFVIGALIGAVYALFRVRRPPPLPVNCHDSSDAEPPA
jgi:hypothetical protein